MANGPVTPVGLNHLVLNVRNMDEFTPVLDRDRRLQAGRAAARHAAAAEPTEHALL